MFDVPVFVKRRNIKNLNLRVKKDGIHISAPILTPPYIIQNFLKDHYEKAKKEYLYLNEHNLKIEDEASINLFGKIYTLRLLKQNGQNEIIDNNIIIYNKNGNFEQELERYFKKLLLIEIEKIASCYYLKLTKENIPDAESVTVRKMKSRWGVCNFKTRRITINWFLVMLDKKYLEYILVHEWCHLLHPNHSKTYWQTVAKIMSNYKIYDQGLKNYRNLL